MCRVRCYGMHNEDIRYSASVALPMALYKYVYDYDYVEPYYIIP